MKVLQDILIAAVPTLCAAFCAYITKKNSQKDNLENAVKCILRANLMQMHERYMEQQCITKLQYLEYNETHDAYKSLNGNGLAEHLKTDIEKLEFAAGDTCVKGE